jgi:hypothetical protein
VNGYQEAVLDVAAGLIAAQLQREGVHPQDYLKVVERAVTLARHLVDGAMAVEGPAI